MLHKVVPHQLEGGDAARAARLQLAQAQSRPDLEWQVGLRYDTVDLDDGLVRGGTEDNWTVGVNWYWRSNYKFSANYVMVDSSKYSSSIKDFQDDNPDIFEFRAQLFW